MARDLTSAILASPNQASTLFGVGGAHPIRPKSLFVMRFLRGVGEGGDEWSNGLSFLVKSIDRPTVQPIVEELNQYNKKRVVHTGVKYNPITCVLYDTADSAAMSMWVQYAQYYFGDYRQDAGSYKDDIISPNMLGTRGVSTSGYGFGISPTSASSIDGQNTQFFFDRIEIYQLWGNEYTSFQIINPRISNFDPDDLDYESSGAAMITMVLNYEAIYHENGGKPQSISTNETLTEMFGGIFNGEVPEPSPSAQRTTSFVSTPAQATKNSILNSGYLQNILNSQDDGVDFDESDRGDTTTSTGGVLSQYGDFDFGDFTSLGTVLPSEASTLTGGVGELSDPFPPWIQTTKQANEFELARLEQSQSRANPDALSSALGPNISSIGDISRGVGSASLLDGTSPLDQVYRDDEDYNYSSSASMFRTNTIPTLDEAFSAPAHTDATVYAERIDTKGMSLSPLAMAAVNTHSDGRSQIGKRTNSQFNPLLAFITEPKPVNTDNS